MLTINNQIIPRFDFSATGKDTAMINIIGKDGAVDMRITVPRWFVSVQKACSLQIGRTVINYDPEQH